VARVNINITARDLTRGELTRMRHNFGALGQDMDRVIGNRTRQNFQRLSQSITQSRRDLMRLRGTIPDEDFFRLDTAIRRAQNRMGQGFRRTNLARVRQDVDRIRDGFRDLDESSRIRVRVDTAALRRADARLATWRRMQARNGVRVRVNPDVDRNTFSRRLGRALTSPARAIGRTVGGVLSDGVGQGISNGFKGAGPMVAAALVVAIGGALAVVGAALSGLLVTALGAAFVGIGGVSAAMSKQVQKHWNTALKSMKKDFAEVGEPMIPVLDKAIDRLTEMSSKSAPVLKQAIENTTDATSKFIDGIMDGFEKFGQAAFKPIMDAWNTFAPIFGQEWSEFMDELGNSFKDMANLVKDHPTEIAAALDVVFEAIDLLVDTVTFLGKTWVFVMQNIGDAIGGVLQAVRYLVIGVDEALYTILDKAATAFGWVPGLGSKLKNARDSFGTFKDDVAGKLEDLANSAYGWDNALNKANKKRKLEADISSYQSQLAKARADMKNTTSKKAKAKLQADISDLLAKDIKARMILSQLDGKSATVTISTYYKTYGAPPPAASAGRLAHGGIARAATGGARNNMTLVGEQGPELVSLAPGSHVRSNPDTRRFMAQNAQPSQPVQVNVVLDGKVLARAMVDPLRGEIRDKGGNVQNALGVRGK